MEALSEAELQKIQHIKEAHWGIIETWQTVRKTHPHINREDVASVVKECTVCKRFLSPITRFPVRLFAEPKQPGEVISLDLWDLFVIKGASFIC